MRLKSAFSTDVWLTILQYLYSGTFEGQSELHDEFMELIKMLAIPLVQSMITQYEKANKNVKQEEVPFYFVCFFRMKTYSLKVVLFDIRQLINDPEYLTTLYKTM